MRPITQTLTLSAAVGNAVCDSQTPAEAGALTIDGANATGGVYTAPNNTPRHLTITTADDESGVTFTIIGTDRNGTTMTFTTTGAGNATTTVYPIAFKTITSITVNDATTDAITIGFAAATHTGWIPLDRYASEVLGIQAELSSGAGLTYQMQATMDNVQAAGVSEYDVVAIDDLGDVVVAGSTNGLFSVDLAATAVRFLVTDWTGGSVIFTAHQRP